MNVLVAYEPAVGRDAFRDLVAKADPEARLFWAEERDNPDVWRSLEAITLMPHRVGSTEKESFTAHAGLLSQMERLSLVVTASTGYEHIDTEYCASRGIAVYNVRDYSASSVSELCIGLTLALLRRLALADTQVREGTWDSGQIAPGTELGGKTVGIVGTGKIGLTTAALFRAFGCGILGWSRTHRASFTSVGGVYLSDLEVMAQESDIVSLHLPLDERTRGAIGAGFFVAMKPSGLLVNTSRAGIIDSEALAEALLQSQIAGAALDVFEEEPLSSCSPLMQCPNLLLAPHLGFKTREALHRLDSEVAGNLRRFLCGDRTNRV